MNLNQYFTMPNATIPPEIAQKLTCAGGITPTTFHDKNDVLTCPSLHAECGYTPMEGGQHYLVSMYTPMPNVTKEMVAWWFWWHPQSSERYKAWYPGEHHSIRVAAKDKPYFSAPTPPPFAPNTQYPTERVGKLFVPLAIEFVTPQTFGFDTTLQHNAEIIVCGHVSACNGLIPNTEMAHLFFATEGGLSLVSRFWLGKNVTNPLLRKLFVTEAQAKGMAEHCCVEYRNFTERIPQMYHAWQAEQASITLPKL